MNTHQNAKTSPAGGALLVEWVLAEERTEDVAREVGVSRQTASKCKKWPRCEGEAGLEDRSSGSRTVFPGTGATRLSGCGGNGADCFGSPTRREARCQRLRWSASGWAWGGCRA